MSHTRSRATTGSTEQAQSPSQSPQVRGGAMALQQSAGNAFVQGVMGNRGGQPQLIVDDSAELQSGQMRRSDFMAKLRATATASVSGALGPEWSVERCPYIQAWFARNAELGARELEAMARRYAGTSVDRADALLAPIAARLHDGVLRWSQGQDVSGDLEATGMATRDEVQDAGDSQDAMVQQKAAPGGGRDADPGQVMAALGEGRPLDGAVSSKMGPALGQDLSGVQVHTDAGAAQAASEQGARAFTVGDHVAFASGEYDPGSPEGAALLAHELAHVGQQAGATQAKGRGATASLERNADSAAAGAVASMYGVDVGEVEGLEEDKPGKGQGLQLQKCSSDSHVRDEQVRAAVEGVISGLGPPGMPFPSPEAARGMLELIQAQARRDYDFYTLTAGGEHVERLFEQGNVDWGWYQREARRLGAAHPPNFTTDVLPIFWADVQANTVHRGRTPPLPL